MTYPKGLPLLCVKSCVMVRSKEIATIEGKIYFQTIKDASKRIKDEQGNMNHIFHNDKYLIVASLSKLEKLICNYPNDFAAD